MKEFGIAIIAVIAVTILLLPLRVALVAAIAIPTAIVMTFGVLQACHVEIQQVSIAALIIVLGMVVDNAIVIVDNYIELLDRGIPIDEAAERSASEMAIPVLTATLAIVAAFFPLCFLSGTVGESYPRPPGHRGAVADHLLPGGDVPHSDDVEVVHPDRARNREPREFGQA